MPSLFESYNDHYPYLNLDYNQVLKNVYAKKLSPIKWMGGKARVVSKLYQKIPKHEVFIDVFTGSAEVSLQNRYFNPSLKKIVLNDMLPELADFYQILKTQPQEFIAEFEKVFNYVDDNEKYKELQSKYKENENHLQKIASYFFLINRGYIAKIGTFVEIKDRDKYLDVFKFRVELANQILNQYNANIYNLNSIDFIDVIKQKYKSDNAFIYCDPPYVYTNQTPYAQNEGKWGADELNMLIKKLKETNLPFAISESKTNAGIFENAGLYVHIMGKRVNVKNEMVEILTTNYKI